MKRSERRRKAEPEGKLSIGSLSRVTGIPVETLRTWENRYGFPVPERKASGHRVYPLSNVARLRRVAEALARGHRAGEVVAATDAELSALLDATPEAAAPPTRVPELVDGEGSLSSRDREAIAEALAAVTAFDAEGLTRLLQRDWARLGPVDFLRLRVAPLVHAVGESWASGELEIRHEHFLSERLSDLLRTLRLPFEEKAKGPLVVLATLPGEAHGLGLQMGALILAVGGCRILNMGTEVPVEQIVSLAREVGAGVVGLSVSSSTGKRDTVAQIERLRRLLPERAKLLVGGGGAPSGLPAGVEVIKEISALDDWARRRGDE
jgi:methanogenic corrinoid protein MtbC1